MRWNPVVSAPWDGGARCSCTMDSPVACTDKPKITPVGMRVLGVRVPPHQSAELTASPSQGEAFLFAFGRCWCRFRGFCATGWWCEVFVHHGQYGRLRPNACPYSLRITPWSLRYGFCQSKPPPPGRGAPWCSRENKPVRTYQPTSHLPIRYQTESLPLKGKVSMPQRALTDEVEPRGLCAVGWWVVVSGRRNASPTGWNPMIGRDKGLRVRDGRFRATT